MAHSWRDENEFTLLKGLIVGSIEETYEDRALMPDGDKFVLVDNLVVSAKVYGLYKLIEQPEHCTHAYCGFDGYKKDAKGFRIKPKCEYVSFRKLTTEELSKPDMSSLHLAMNVSYLQKMDLLNGLAVFDTANEKFADTFFQDGGNDRLVPIGNNIVRKVLTSKTNYQDLLDVLKKTSL